jgi:hypothetical protein
MVSMPQLTRRLEDFFVNDASAFRTFSEIVGQRHRVSLRMLDWTCTNYSRAHALSIGGQDVHATYQSHLMVYGKQLFDPFCRMNKLEAWGKRTSIGQLNFLMWAIEFGLVSWIDANWDAVRDDIRTSVRDRRRAPTGSKKHRKQTFTVRPVFERVDVRFHFA